MTDVIVLRLLAEFAHAHVFDHAGAQRADGRLAHRSAPGLEVWLWTPHPQTRALHIPLLFPLPGLNAASATSLPQATAVSFAGTGRPRSLERQPSQLSGVQPKRLDTSVGKAAGAVVDPEPTKTGLNSRSAARP